MKRLSFLLLLMAVASRSDRIYFPDEIQMMYDVNYYKTTPANIPRFSTNKWPFAQAADDGNYQPAAPPPRLPPINSVITQSPSTYRSEASLPSLGNVLPPYWRNHVNDIISRGVLKFALDMDRAITNSSQKTAEDLERNVIFSPLSLAGTMALVLLASGGRTFDEVVKILGLQSGVDISRHSELVHQMFGSLIEQINTKKGPGEPVANYASGIFVQEGFPIRPLFKEISQMVYKSEIMNLDFLRNPAHAQDVINYWVRDKTEKKISDILREPPSPDTMVILASALYFNGEWNLHFINEITKRREFFIEPNKSVDVDMMFNGGVFPIFEDRKLGAKILGLPYKGREVTMYIVLPTKPGAKALKDFESTLTPEILEYLIGNMRNYTCIVAMPRMKLSSSLDLKDALRTLGLNSLFEPKLADLSLLSQGREYSNKINPGPIASRFGDDDGESVVSTPLKKYFFKYMVDGYAVEQWSTGFNLRRLARNAAPPLKRRIRQNRPIDQAFLDFVNQQKFPSYGLDDLRNSHTIVNPHLYADNVLHRVEININEKGTEAAAATSVGINRDGDQKKLIADRPFLFFIRHDPSKLIWFWGTVNKPEPYYRGRK